MVLPWLGTENSGSCQQVTVLPSFFTALFPGLAVTKGSLERWREPEQCGLASSMQRKSR